MKYGGLCGTCVWFDEWHNTNGYCKLQEHEPVYNCIDTCHCPDARAAALADQLPGMVVVEADPNDSAIEERKYDECSF